MDWGAASYERTAADLEPAAEVAVDAAGAGPGTTLLDVACGTGNAALAAAARGARVSGVDGAERLVEVARERASRAGVEADFAVGDMAALPYPDDAFDATVSVFGAIFAADPAAVGAELMRVTRPGGVVVVTAWIRRGAISNMVARSMEHARRAGVSMPPPPALEWGNRDHLPEILAGARLQIEARTIAFTAASPRAYLEDQIEHHPGFAEPRATLPPPALAALADDLTGVLEAGNEDPGGFRVTSEYLLVTAAV